MLPLVAAWGHAFFTATFQAWWSQWRRRRIAPDPCLQELRRAARRPAEAQAGQGRRPLGSARSQPTPSETAATLRGLAKRVKFFRMKLRHHVAARVVGGARCLYVGFEPDRPCWPNRHRVMREQS